MQLAHEYGLKTIVIDPRYTQSAEILADQWIPIRPGTDLAMMLAVAQVLYEEDLIDHEFVDKWVDKEGFEEWGRYVMGEGEDGIKKTPEWAAPICAVPADMCAKAVRAGVPLLVSKSVPTDKTVAMAQAYDLTLICKATSTSFDVFWDPIGETLPITI